MGSASMSPRNSTVRPCDGPFSVTIKPEVDGPSSYVTSSPASASRTASTVLGKCNPNSGCSWILRRSATVSGNISRAALSQFSAPTVISSFPFSRHFVAAGTPETRTVCSGACASISTSNVSRNRLTAM